MIPMGDNIKSSERSVGERQVSINAKANSKSISNTYQPRTVKNDIKDPLTEHTASETLYILFFQSQSCFYYSSLGNVVYGQYRIQLSLLWRFTCLYV